jgi:hypothetical protein
MKLLKITGIKYVNIENIWDIVLLAGCDTEHLPPFSAETVNE